MELNDFGLESLEERTLLSASFVSLPFAWPALPKIAALVASAPKPATSSLSTVVQNILANASKICNTAQVKAIVAKLPTVSLTQAQVKVVTSFFQNAKTPAAMLTSLTNLVNAIKANPYCPFNPLVRLLFP